MIRKGREKEKHGNQGEKRCRLKLSKRDLNKGKVCNIPYVT